MVEKDEERADELSSDLGISMVHGDGLKMKVLEEAGVEDCDALAAITPSDEVNFMAVKLNRKAVRERVVARVNRRKNKEMFDREEVDVMISYTSATIGLYEKAIVGSEIYGILTLGERKQTSSKLLSPKIRKL